MRTVDVFTDTLPSEFSERDRLSENRIYAYVALKDADGDNFCHLLLTKEQWDYHSSRTPKPAWVKSVKKNAKRFFKDTLRDDGTTEDGPRHVFGSFLYDPDDNEIIPTGGRKTKKLSNGD